MVTLKELLTEDLKIINKKIISATNKDEINLLKKDRSIITNYLSPNKNVDINKINFDLGITDTKEKIYNNISNLCLLSDISKSYFIKKNDYEFINFLNSFIINTEFNLSSIYSDIVLNNGIVYSKEKRPYYGYNLFIPSLNKNYFKIIQDKILYECNCLVHELGHAQINIENKKKNIDFKKNSFSESYPIFLELIFSDFLKEKGRKKESYQIKYMLFNKIKTLIRLLNEEIYDYLNSNENNKIFKFYYERNYRELKSSLLALYIYDLYKNNKKEGLILIKNFINYSKLLDDNQLIKEFNIDESYLTNNYIYKLYIQIENEINDIKQKRKGK